MIFILLMSFKVKVVMYDELYGKSGIYKIKMGKIGGNGESPMEAGKPLG